jgi:hypothetical protein
VVSIWPVGNGARTFGRHCGLIYLVVTLREEATMSAYEVLATGNGRCDEQWPTQLKSCVRASASKVTTGRKFSLPNCGYRHGKSFFW